MNTSENQADIAIVGGGLIGLCAALALQQPNRKISVIESSSLIQGEGDSSGLNTRSIALSYASVQIFKALGIWNEVKSLSASIQSIHISARGRWGVSRLRASDYELEALGYVIESKLLGNCLLDKVSQSKLITLVTNATFESADVEAAVQLNYSSPEGSASLQASLLLIADGAQSKARESLGIEHRSIDYGQSAIITNLCFDKPVLATAYERFTDSGPLAMLPLGQNRYACVWTCRPDTAVELMALEDADFVQSLQQCFGYRLGYIQQMGQRFSFPLARTEALSLTKKRCVLIGNAANALHPVAGQGFNLGLRDIASLQGLLEGQSIARLDSLTPLLAEYEQLRQAEQRQVIRLGDGLVNLFSNDLPILKHLRSAALALLDILPALKSEVALSGMGLAKGGNGMLRGRLR
ncbi:MAG: 2-octaprenyl-6-methoxyphenol hydroxylase [Gammaproteobacteria bacterium]|jgi:2-octaprenyl-6-methoxyphenol hydroxylase